MTTSAIYVLHFMAESPMIGLDPQPGSSPQEHSGVASHEAHAEALNARPAIELALLEQEAIDDHASLMADRAKFGHEAGPDEPDMTLHVRIHDDGLIEVYGNEPGAYAPENLIAQYTIADVYEAFGVDVPSWVKA